ncbi:uncharacterized protein METZ01_LOCUS196110 [marine metagenome]|uniref:Uncharacterized protein n=1 Tax=marine metagenome TaxID=408172 RepID=A0A382DXL3_9ZZZZ
MWKDLTLPVSIQYGIGIVFQSSRVTHSITSIFPMIAILSGVLH